MPPAPRTSQRSASEAPPTSRQDVQGDGVPPFELILRRLDLNIDVEGNRDPNVPYWEPRAWLFRDYEANALISDLLAHLCTQEIQRYLREEADKEKKERQRKRNTDRMTRNGTRRARSEHLVTLRRGRSYFRNGSFLRTRSQ